MEQDENTPTPLRRTRVACKSCNAKRVKCDAGEGQPCWHCRMRKINCELIESKRGKYARGRRSGGAQRASQPRRLLNTPDVRPHPELPNHSGISSPVPQSSRNSSQGLGSSRGLFEPSEGGSTTIHYVIELNHKSSGDTGEPVSRVDHPIPASIVERPRHEAFNQPQAPISLQEALLMPTPDILHQLIHTFFVKIHPAYPVFDREAFLKGYHANQASPLILQTIALLGFTIGSDDLVRAAGFADRATARKTHYLRAKTLYDIDYETDRMNLVACLLLLGFWWAGPEDQKDTCYWVNCASTVAQSFGMHRSMQSSVVTQRTKSLRKRIWWSIYTRDRHVSAAFGRPYLIRDEDCDIEPLAEADFTFDTAYTPGLIPAHNDFNTFYVIEMCKLATIIGDVMTGEYSPRSDARPNIEPQALDQRLTMWESGLPDRLKLQASDDYSGASFWACMLQFSYQNTIILLFRPKAIENLSSTATGRDLRARNAADRITRLAEDLLATGSINSGLIHLVPALFSALSVHTFVICRGESIQRQLAENKSRQCMLALSVIAKSWPVRIWISKSFLNLMKRLTGQGQTLNESALNVSSRIITSTRQWTMPTERLQPPESIPQSTRESGPPNLESQPTNINLQSEGLNADSSLWKNPGEFVQDSMWAEYLDNALDVDLLLYQCADPEQNGPFEMAN